ncbi:MAG: hypothetical protein QXF26_04010, partial [Candidatus Bathyarchaeia archaeon]
EQRIKELWLEMEQSMVATKRVS